MQTAFPAKVVSWSSSNNTVELEPQFIETWVRSDGETQYEQAPESANIGNVPVCYPWHMTWDITVGAFGLVICTKYSLNQWRQQLRRMDPGDLRRFTMSGATFHPVVIGESPNATQQSVAIANKTEDEIDRIWYVLTTWTPGVTDSGAALKSAAIAERGTPADPGLTGAVDCASTTVKVSE
jgi:hypothetical protein